MVLLAVAAVRPGQFVVPHVAHALSRPLAAMLLLAVAAVAVRPGQTGGPPLAHLQHAQKTVGCSTVSVSDPPSQELLQVLRDPNHHHHLTLLRHCNSRSESHRVGQTGLLLILCLILHPVMELVVHGLPLLLVLVVVVVLVVGEQSGQCAGVGEVPAHPQEEGRQAEGSACT